MATEEERDRARSIYMNNLGEEFNFYAGEADDDGLAAVYQAGFEAGKKEKN